MTRHELSERSDVSSSFLSDLTSGKANPSLKTMESIADALETPLPFLLELTDLSKEDLDFLFEGKRSRIGLPDGYERVSVILSSQKAYQVKKWSEETKQKLKEVLEDR